MCFIELCRASQATLDELLDLLGVPAVSQFCSTTALGVLVSVFRRYLRSSWEGWKNFSDSFRLSLAKAFSFGKIKPAIGLVFTAVDFYFSVNFSLNFDMRQRKRI
jgi:hypothetical protein